MNPNKQTVCLNCFLAKDSDKKIELKALLNQKTITTKYSLKSNHGLSGDIFVKSSKSHRPTWADFLEEIADSKIAGLESLSSSAIVFIRIDKRVLAFAFGFGRHLLELSMFEPDFGIKTALNTLDHESLVGVDLHTLEDRPIQKKAQASLGADVSAFGIDVSRDVLRAVTGRPIKGINFSRVSGGDAMFSFSAQLSPADLGHVATDILGHYNNNNYKKNFIWVDNIRKVKTTGDVDRLDDKLIRAISLGGANVAITIPEIIDWDIVDGFSFTRNKQNITPMIETRKYLSGIEKTKLSVGLLKSDCLFVHESNGDVHPHSIYKSIYFEARSEKKTHILFGGIWYEVNTDFVAGIESTLKSIGISSIVFPPVETWTEYDTKKKKDVEKIESEGDYNVRVAAQLNLHLLDKKLVKSTRSTTPIELCDLLSPLKQLIHAKHKKGGSAGLSHLFAQGGVSAELMLGDRQFRQEARKVLKLVDDKAPELVPLAAINPKDYEIVFLVLGDNATEVVKKLPLFSKVNLSRTFENLSQKGYSVTISGADKIERP